MTQVPSDLTISVLIVEDDPCMRDALCAGIAMATGIHVVAACDTVGAAMVSLALHAPDVLLVDLGLPDGSGIDVIAACAARHPQCNILVITLFGDENNVLAAVDAGAAGYLLKDNEQIDVAQCIKNLRQGGSPMSPLVARKLLLRARRPTRATAAAPLADASAAGLTAREQEALELIARGYTYNEIAAELAVSVNTVQTHVKRVYSKLAVRSRGQAVFAAHQQGLLPPDLLVPGRG